MGRERLVDLKCKKVKETDLAIAIVDGTTEEVVDRQTGEVTERAKWFWIPKSQCDFDADAGVITMTERTATEKGLV